MRRGACSSYLLEGKQCKTRHPTTSHTREVNPTLVFFSIEFSRMITARLSCRCRDKHSIGLNGSIASRGRGRCPTVVFGLWESLKIGFPARCWEKVVFEVPGMVCRRNEPRIAPPPPLISFLCGLWFYSLTDDDHLHSVGFVLFEF